MPTFSPDSFLAARFHNARPGLELVAIDDAALPVALVTADVLAQDRKRLPLLEEFVLRLVNANVRDEDAITGFLGLPEGMVTDTIAEQFSADYLTYAPPGPSAKPNDRPLKLTVRGEQTARELASVTPVRVSLPLVYDQLLWKVRPYDRHAVITRRQAEEEGLLLLPAAQQEPIQTSDIAPSEINALLRDRGDASREVLLLKRVTQSKARRVLPAKILVYADADRADIQLGAVIDGELSHAHELALLSYGGAKALGIRVEPPHERPTLDPELERVRVPLSEVTNQRSEAAAQLTSPTYRSAAQEGPDPDRGEIRAISVFEHPDLLDEALTQAIRRILLISPWIKRAIVTTDFISKLEGRLRRGVTVHIAHGYSEDDAKSDTDAIRRLKNLASRYPDKFTVTRLKSTHAKILIYDDVWIATSFNWLSFRGSRDRTYRMEEGTFVRGKQVTDEQYRRYLAQIERDRL